MTTIYEANRIAHAELLAASLARAKEDAINLRDTVRDHLKAALPVGYKLDVQDRKNGYNGEPERSLVVRDEDGTTYTLRFLCVQTGRYRSGGYIAAISGESYERNGRRHCPNFEPRKDKTYNLKALTEDVLTAITRRRHEQARSKYRDDALTRSRATFDAIGWQPPFEGASYARRDYGRFNVEINAGEYSNGAVRVQVKLKDEYLNAEQVAELLARLEMLK